MCTQTEVLEAKAAPVVESSLSNIDCSKQVFWQTIMVTLRWEGDRQVRVLMDPGSQRSYVRKHTARSLQYAPVREEELIHGLFGGKRPSLATISVIRYDLEVWIISTPVILKH
jgi:hypothetical protein